jgi:hypothetical protein
MPRIEKRLYGVRNRIGYWISILVILFGVGYCYWSTHASTVYGGDAGDLASAIITHGIPHPPGYPLYTLLGIDLMMFIPNKTAAWKIIFLSHIPALVSLIILFDTLVLMTKRLYSSLVAVCVLAFLYPFWLYASVIEVFALNNFFIAFLLWNFIRWMIIKEKKYWYAGWFTLGLSLTHHHIILFFVPVIFTIIFHKHQQLTFKMICYGAILFLIGLLPYLYIPIASVHNPAVNWQGPPTIQNFIDLVTRAGYGTFKAGGFAADHPVLRLLDVYAFLDFVYKDFRPLGVVIIIVGLISMWKRDKNIFLPIATGIVSYMFFLFYASFPLVDNFLLATYERFVQPLYVLLCVVIAYGIQQSIDSIADMLKKIVNKESSLLVWSIMLVFIVYPLGVGYLNYYKIHSLSDDRTAERLGEDILNSVPGNSILFVTTDTPLFNSQYDYYAEKKWPDLIFIHYTKLYTDYYRQQLSAHYPTLRLADKNAKPQENFQEIIEKNYRVRPITSKTSFASPAGVWIPYGLIFRYYKKNDIPSDKDIYEANERLWSAYQNPTEGSLGVYTNLMLSDVLRSYAVAHQETAYWEMRHNYIDKSIEHLKSSEKFDSTDPDSYVLLTQAYILKKSCTDAQTQIEKLLELDKDNLDAYQLMILNAKQCFKDQKKVDEYMKLFDEKQKKKAIPLHSL